MIDKVLSIIGLFKELPEAIGYSVFGPLAFSLPHEIREAIGQSASKEIDSVNVIYLQIDNFTNREIEELSILYRGNFSFTPDLYFESRDIRPTYKHVEDEKKISIYKIPPKDSLNIEIFFEKNEKLSIDKVLADSALVTKWMQKIANMHRYPRFAFTTLIIFAFAFSSLFFAGWSVYKTWSHNENYKIVNEAMADWDGCSPYPFQNSIESEKLLERQFKQQKDYQWWILQLNKVDSFDDLKLKDTVILCRPESPNK